MDVRFCAVVCGRRAAFWGRCAAICRRFSLLRRLCEFAGVALQNEAQTETTRKKYSLEGPGGYLLQAFCLRLWGLYKAFKLWRPFLRQGR